MDSFASSAQAIIVGLFIYVVPVFVGVDHVGFVFSYSQTHGRRLVDLVKSKRGVPDCQHDERGLG